jgi:hypothetical protein
MRRLAAFVLVVGFEVACRLPCAHSRRIVFIFDFHHFVQDPARDHSAPDGFAQLRRRFDLRVGQISRDVENQINARNFISERPGGGLKSRIAAFVTRRRFGFF